MASGLGCNAEMVTIAVNNPTVAGEMGMHSDGTPLYYHSGAVKKVFGAATPPSITGSRGGNAAVASLLTQLAAANVIVDNTTA